LFDLFGMPDCAAELLVNRREVVADVSDTLLDQLAEPDRTTPGAYRDYIAAFEADPQSLYRRRREPEAARQGAGGTASGKRDAELERLRSRVNELKSKTADLIDRLRRRDEQIENLTKQPR